MSKDKDSGVMDSNLSIAHKAASLPEHSTDPGRYFLLTKKPLASCLHKISHEHDSNCRIQKFLQHLGAQ